MRLQGVFVATISPFATDGKLDLGAYKAHLDFLANHGVHGFVPCGTTGESPTLSDSEWSSLIETTRVFAQSKKLVTIAGCGGNATEKVLANLKKLEGCDAALVVAPYYNKPGQDGLIAHYSRLADESKTPILIYNIPGRTGVNIAPETLARLLKHQNIIGVKEATGNHGQWLDLVEKIDTRNKALLAGDDNAIATLMGMGGSGVISASANVIPRECVAIYDAATKGDFRSAFALQIKVNRLIRAMFMETNPAPAKAALNILQGVSPTLRLPLTEAGEDTRKELSSAMRELGILR